MDGRGEEAYMAINERAEQAVLTDFVEWLRSISNPADTVMAFDEWWASGQRTMEQRRIMLLVVWGAS